ncbi:MULTISPECIES: thioredoxin domain-containing protein [unclassified Streptomyces]|uniref:DsbA family protein n=2 Tax=Streptomyces TaxID=1883 RepID=UPI002DD99D56|nr:thioredoxin domain-containing protein [Streptomyces sp. NBC_00243]WRZ20246.1 DsbA family protein [Streptomyces sp. NBC_00243]
MVRGGGGRFAAVVVAGVLGLFLGGCGQRAGQAEPERTAAYAGLGELPEKLDADGTTIVVGDPEASLTVHLYEDPRCPYCEEFESTGGGPALRALTERREVKTEYTLASFLDDRMGGSGSKKAVNALRAALEVGKFAEYHAVLYENQPEEVVDGFTEAYLLELAGEVDGLRGQAFDSAVKTMKYRDFVTKSEQAYESAGEDDPRGPGTPTAVINGVRVPEGSAAVLYDQELFNQLLEEIKAQPGRWASLGL